MHGPLGEARTIALSPNLGGKCSGPWQVQLLITDPPAGIMRALLLEALLRGFCMLYLPELTVS